MDVREAVKSAKQNLLELFNSEPISYVGLEEVEFDDDTQEWIITISFARPLGNNPFTDSARRATSERSRFQGLSNQRQRWASKVYQGSYSDCC